jgi:hypothetical protein
MGFADLAASRHAVPTQLRVRAIRTSAFRMFGVESEAMSRDVIDRPAAFLQHGRALRSRIIRFKQTQVRRAMSILTKVLIGLVIVTVFPVMYSPRRC